MHLSLSMLRESRERSGMCQFSQNPFIHWALDTALIGRMVEGGERIVMAYGG